jgi:hypothetical protein
LQAVNPRKSIIGRKGERIGNTPYHRNRRRESVRHCGKKLLEGGSDCPLAAKVAEAPTTVSSEKEPSHQQVVENDKTDNLIICSTKQSSENPSNFCENKPKDKTVERCIENKFTQTTSEDEASEEKIVTITKATPTINHLKINSLHRSETDSSSDEEINSKRTKQKRGPIPEKEVVDMSTCLTALNHHIIDFLKTIKQGLFLAITYLIFHLLGDDGIKISILIFIGYQSFIHFKPCPEKVDPKVRINRMEPKKGSQKNLTKTIYDDLKIPTKNKVELQKKLLAFKNNRRKIHQHSTPDFEESLLIEEPVELPSYPSDVPAHLKFMIKGSVNEIPVSWEIDSGSCTTLISSDIFDKISNRELLHKIPLTVTYADFQGNTVKALGKYRLTIMLGKNVHTTHEVLVVDHPDKSQSHALLGVDIVRSKRLGIDHDGNSRAYLSFIVGEVVKRIELKPIQECFVTDTTEVEGGEIGMVQVSLLNNINKISLQNVDEIQNTQGIMTCTTNDDYKLPTISLCHLDNTASFQIPVHNKQFGPLKLFKGQTIGAFSPLPPETILQSTSNVFEKIGNNSKRTDDLGSCILQLSEAFNTVKPERVRFIKAKSTENEVFRVKHRKREVKTSVTEVEIHNNEISFPKVPQISELDEWKKAFQKIKNTLGHANTITIDFSAISVVCANYIQVAFHEIFADSETKLQLTHKSLQIHKTTLTHESSEDSSAPDEDDLCEPLFQPRRISSSVETWTSLLKHVPEYLRKKVFYLLTTKYPKVIAKSTVDFGECTLPNSQFKIELSDTTAITCRPYPLNVVYKDFVDETINEMVDSGLLIQESSAYGSGVFVRTRPDSTGKTHRHRTKK